MPDPAKPDIKIVGTVASETATEHGLPFASTAGTNALSEYGLFAGLLVRRGWLPPWSLRRELGPAAGSCAFLNCHGDLRIEWEEKDHAAIVRLIAQKQAEGVRFFEVDHSGDKLVPIIRRGPTGKQVFVRDDMLRQVIDAGFARFPTTKFEATSASTARNTRQLGDPEQISRAHTIAVPPMVRGDGLIATQQFEGDVIETKAIAEFLTSEPMQAIMGGRDIGPWDEKRVNNQVHRGHLPIFNRPRRVARQHLADWFADRKAGRDEMARLSKERRAIILDRRAKTKMQHK